MKRPLLWLALLAHALFASVYLIGTPAHEGPDENAHAYYASYLWHTRTLPVIQADCSPLTGGAAAHHPPLYYATIAAIAQALGTGDWSPYWQLNPEWMWDLAYGPTHRDPLLRLINPGNTRYQLSTDVRRRWEYGRPREQPRPEDLPGGGLSGVVAPPPPPPRPQ